MTGLIAASILSPLFLDFGTEIRSSYQSLGKLLEDRPMNVVSVRAGVDAGDCGRFGIRNWDVSSLTDRRADVHRHALYHTEFGPTWQYDFEIADSWVLKSDLTRSWTMYRGFRNKANNRTYHWWQVEQSLENPYLVPFWRLRKCFRGNDYFYFKAGVRRRFALTDHLYVTPSVFFEGGSSRDIERVVGVKPDGGSWKSGVASVSFRLETGWRFNSNASAFVYIEQYDVIGGEARSVNGSKTYLCAHDDWTHGGFGVRFRF